MSDYGSCWCCATHGLDSPAVSTAGLCRPCGSRSPSACATRHEQELAAVQAAADHAAQRDAWQQAQAARARQRRRPAPRQQTTAGYRKAFQ
jgi:hypothetical protein